MGQWMGFDECPLYGSATVGVHGCIIQVIRINISQKDRQADLAKVHFGKILFSAHDHSTAFYVLPLQGPLVRGGKS